MAPPQPAPGFLFRVRQRRARASLSGMTFFSLGLGACLLATAIGCNSSSASSASQAKASEQQARKAAQTKEAEAREELEQILPPSKSRYLEVHDKNAYDNPFLTVNPETITINFIFPDEDPESFGTGTLLRPAAARKQQMEIRLRDLPEALSSLPAEVWPYGRVVAVAESPAPRPERIAIRRNVENTIQVLNDLGVVVDEWSGANGQMLR